MIERLRLLGWYSIELGFLSVAACILLGIIIGPDSGYISFVSDNAQKFLQSLPPGVALGLAVVVSLGYWVRQPVR